MLCKALNIAGLNLLCVLELVIQDALLMVRGHMGMRLIGMRHLSVWVKFQVTVWARISKG